MARGILREALRLAWVRLHSPSYWGYYKWKRGLAEPEIALLPVLCSMEGVSLDIGGNIGLYTNQLLQCSGRCIAFEPLPHLATLLKRAFGRAGERFQVEQVALSDREGVTQLRMPQGSFGYSTIEPSNALEGKVGTEKIVSFDVTTRRLDDYDLQNVHFVKIDVEGHELSVLRGGLLTLQRNQPTLLIEVEDRHNLGSVAKVHAFLQELGYESFFLSGDQLRPFAEFDLTRHQDMAAPRSYIRNFIFVPAERRDILNAALASHLAN